MKHLIYLLSIILFIGCTTQTVVIPPKAPIVIPKSDPVLVPSKPVPASKYISGTKCTDKDYYNINYSKQFQSLYNTYADQLAKDEIRQAPIRKPGEDKLDYAVAVLQYKHNVESDVKSLNYMSEVINRYTSRVSTECKVWLTK